MEWVLDPLITSELHLVLTQAASLVAQALGAEKVDVFLYQQESKTLVALGVSETPLGRLEQSIGMDRLPLVNGGRAVSIFQAGISYRNGQVDHDPEELPGIKQGMGVRSTITAPHHRTAALMASGMENA